MAQVAMVPSDQLSLFDLGVDLAKLRERSIKLLAWKRAPGTHRIYESDFRIFSQWCSATGKVALPTTEDTLVLFLTAQLDSGLKVSTVERRLASISFRHNQAKHTNPNPAKSQLCREVLKCARRERREKKQGKSALDVKDLKRICQRLGDTNAGIRDRSILVFGFASGLRRSEISRLDLKDVQVSAKGLVVSVSWSKQDQSGEGRTFGIFAGERPSTDPVRIMRAWLAVRGKEPGPLFTQIQHGCDEITLKPISGKVVRDVVKRSVRLAGLDEAKYGAHSLRAGLVTAAAGAGASDREIMRASGHKTVKVMEQYIRHSRVFAERNPLVGVL